MSKNDRTISERKDGKWANTRDGASRAASLHNTQREATVAATRMLHNAGGGELKVKDVHGKIRSKDTINPGHDPNPPKDKEHLELSPKW